MAFRLGASWGGLFVFRNVRGGVSFPARVFFEKFFHPIHPKTACFKGSANSAAVCVEQRCEHMFVVDSLFYRLCARDRGLSDAEPMPD